MSEEDEYFAYLLDIGVIKEMGVEDGEMLYAYDLEKMEETLPEMYEEVMDGINARLLSLFEKGLLSIEYDNNLKAHFSATEEGLAYFKTIKKKD